MGLAAKQGTKGIEIIVVLKDVADEKRMKLLAGCEQRSIGFSFSHLHRAV